MAILLFYIFGTGCHTSATHQHCSASQPRSSVPIVVIFIKDRFLAEFVELDTPKTFLTPNCVVVIYRRGFTVRIESEKESKKCLLEQQQFIIRESNDRIIQCNPSSSCTSLYLTFLITLYHYNSIIVIIGLKMIDK
ncbi:hypothetical protein T05_12940 [Trichinella murrelli]|uniref:Uncharacterized protein n=1 Tax=Trichinella murrelli TaxID=144512 RepID=A0A0V0TG38_9BILA|nr:hypothetical protein T05_12940 [Trichinella murrelli]